MLDVERIFRLKNMEVYKIDNLNEYREWEPGMVEGSFYKRATIMLMDLRRPVNFDIDKNVPKDDDPTKTNYVKVVVLSNFEVQDDLDLIDEIVYFCEQMRGSLEYCFYIEFFKFEDFKKFESSDFGDEDLDDDDYYCKEMKDIYDYYRKIGEYYGVQFEQGDFDIEKFSHLSQD